MNADLIQNLRYKVQKRVRRLNAVSYQHFHATLKQFWAFVHAQPILVGIVDELLPGSLTWDRMPSSKRPPAKLSSAITSVRMRHSPTWP
jgi:hypothetical protein